MATRCRCVSTCQFRGNVAEKGEVYLIGEDELDVAFIRNHFTPVDQVQTEQPAKAETTRASRKKKAPEPIAISADELPFMKEGR